MEGTQLRERKGRKTIEEEERAEERERKEDTELMKGKIGTQLLKRKERKRSTEKHEGKIIYFETRSDHLVCSSSS